MGGHFPVCHVEHNRKLLGPAAHALIGDEVLMEFVASVMLKNVKDPTPAYTLCRS